MELMFKCFSLASLIEIKYISYEIFRMHDNNSFLTWGVRKRLTLIILRVKYYIIESNEVKTYQILLCRLFC